MRTIIIIVAMVLINAGVVAQNIDAILKSVEQNNVELRAMKKGGEAQALDIKTQNSLEDPTVEYSPFFAKGTSGVASSELVVKQGFEFPTLYAARSKSGKLQKDVVDLRYLIRRRDIMLQAKQLCLDMVFLNKERELLSIRSKNAEELMALAEKRMKCGSATIIELNKIKMERMSVETEVTQNDAAYRTAFESLLALNGNKPLEFDQKEYPLDTFMGDFETLYNRAVAMELSLRMAGAEVKALGQDVRVNKQNWMPKLELGYRRNTSGDEASNGFLVGASFPLFSSRHKLKSAKARFEQSELVFDSERLKTENKVRADVNDMRLTRKAAEVYDIELLHSTLELLRKAVDGGEMSLTDYYVEADVVYKNLQTHMQLENKYQKLLAEINKNEL